MIMIKMIYWKVNIVNEEDDLLESKLFLLGLFVRIIC